MVSLWRREPRDVELLLSLWGIEGALRMKNITIFAFCEEWHEGRDREDMDYREHAAEYRLLYPEGDDIASVMLADLLVEGDADDHGEWETTLLFDGREAETDAELERERLLRELAESGWRAAQVRQRAAKAERERKERERRAEEDERRRVREEASKEKGERAEFERLSLKYSKEAAQ